ncbi:E3 ubiquitin ligase BIG BROTHER-related-like [Rutidosis leptorrhynchoides]|uniref:E3 ubiquitin ligase BIG BROTHER-related-like n=1 Tax=Rutidosis leptorrhynchoides TaxID=125765 RepID=UPI003A990DE9
MSTDINIHEHYLNVSLPADIPDDLREFLPEEEEDEGLTYEEVILQQATVYQSYQDNYEVTRNTVVVSDDDGDNDNHDDDDDHHHHHISDSSCSSDDDSETSRRESDSSHEATDEAFARSLQEMGEEFDEFFIAEFNTENLRATPTEQETSTVSSQDDVDPDNMRYEELVSLTETVGVENIGLSAARISQLPISIYTSGMFSMNNEDNCVICQENYKFGKHMITLPCFHQYHSKCIIKWLKLKKNCPICQKEVA